MSRFIIVGDRLTAAQQNAVTNFVQAQGWQVWHWFENLWLLDKVPPPWDVKSVFEQMDQESSLQGALTLILQVSDPMSFWGRAPKDSWPWIEEWVRKDQPLFPR